MADDDDRHPFSGIPFLGDIASLLSGSETALWEGARQAATQLAGGGKPEHNVDPLERHRLSEISRVAELHVARVTQMQGAPRLEPVTRSGWATDALGAVRPLMDRLSKRLSQDIGQDASTSPDPFAGLLAMMSPMTVAMTAGMMVGHLAAGAFGNSDLLIPMPRTLIVTANVTAFADEWSLEADDVMLWAAIREHAMHAVLAQPDIAGQLEALLRHHIEGFRPRDRSLDVEELGLADLGLDDLGLGDRGGEHLGGPDFSGWFGSDGSPPESRSQMHRQLHQQLQRIFGNPELLLGVARDDRHDDTSRLETLISVLTAYVDDVIAQAGRRLIGGYEALNEAVRRRDVGTQGADYADRLLGIRLSAEARGRGERFIAGVIERAGREGLTRLFEPGGLPTPNEFDAAGLWLARLDLNDAH
ncbi:zinc-dependent metalloprotease [Candidatus Poriferisodalis sp.]|uniref:zinc-dependent metalloprotease n=1 Tax=Candidatus Poriferisodalis sp. TaxID=3101277 RepID=UPI003B02B98C